MTDTPSPPTGSGAVPAQPVVQIEIFGSTVSVNGVVIVHDGTQSLHHVAVHAAAERVAKVLGRPVRAQAIDAEGRATLVVHPDGHASDVELVETYDSEAEAVAATAAPVQSAPPPPPIVPVVPGVAGAAVGPPPPVARPAGPPVGAPPVGPPTEALSGTAAFAAAAAARTGAPASTPSGWPSKVVRMVAVAAALVAVIGMGVLLLTSRSGDEPEAKDPDTTPVAVESPTTAPTESTDTGQPLPSPAVSTPGVSSELPSVSVRTEPSPSSLRLIITTDASPTTAEVVVTAGAKTVTRTIDLKGTETARDFGDLPEGPATWQVSVPGAAPQRGDITIPPPYAAPTPTPTPEPVVPVTPVEPLPPVTTVTAAPPATKSSPKPQPKKSPKAKPKPSSDFGDKPTTKSKPKDKIKDKGSKGTGPTGPVDPDDHLALRGLTVR